MFEVYDLCNMSNWYENCTYCHFTSLDANLIGKQALVERRKKRRSISLLLKLLNEKNKNKKNKKNKNPNLKCLAIVKKLFSQAE